MSPKNRSLRFGWLSALIGIILLLEACGSSKGGLPACSVDELEQPRIISPEADELIDAHDLLDLPRDNLPPRAV
jgi:hypothetical protein